MHFKHVMKFSDFSNIIIVRYDISCSIFVILTDHSLRLCVLHKMSQNLFTFFRFALWPVNQVIPKFVLPLEH